MHYRGPYAFSVIELLMVLTIIALLIGLVLPAVGRVRHQARVATCVNNAGAIAAAFGAYLDDHRGVYPADGDPGNGIELAGWNLLGKQGQVRGGPGSTPASNRPLNPYLESTDLAHCPLDARRSGHSSRYNRFGSSYFYEDRPRAAIESGQYVVQWGVWFIAGHHADEVKHPEKKLLIGDAVRRLNHLADRAHNHWHNRSEPLEVSVAFADGHAANVPRKVGTGPGEPAEYETTQVWRHPTPQQLQQLDDWAGNTTYY